MLSRFQQTLLAFMILLLPIQGAVAASRWICFATESASVVASANHSHLSVGHQHHLDSASEDVLDLAVGHDSEAPTSHDSNGACQLCAACCLTSAAPPPPLALSSPPPANAGFLSVSARVPHYVADGPERPPRNI